jgi:hypothetical protein
MLKYLIFFLSFSAFADIQLNWIPPSERADNSPLSLSEIESYRIYYNADGSTAYPNFISIAPTDTHTMVLPPATYYFVLTVFDFDGRESIFSDIVVATEPDPPPPVIAPPKSVTGLEALAL